MTVFLIEDDAAVADSMASWLSSHGQAVRSFTSGESFFAGDPPGGGDVMIVDLGLPGLGGGQVLRWISRLRDQPRVVVLTGQSRHAIAASLRGLTAVAVVRKPPDAAALAAALGLAAPGTTG